MTPRISPRQPPYPPELQNAFNEVMKGAPPLVLFQIVARNPRVAQRMMAGGLLDKGSLSFRQRELMILRTTALCGAEYEWGVHVSAFRSVCNWSDAEVEASSRGDDSLFLGSPDEQLIIRLADSLHEHNDVGNDLWKQLKTVFSDEQLIELIMLAGLYHAVSFLCRALRVPLEESATRFPD